ncbi:MAG: hypothetical protein ACE5KH_01810 [Candidatus Geothermarchaeales archaeon]
MGRDGWLPVRIVVVLLVPFFIVLLTVAGVWAGLYLSQFITEIYTLPLAAILSLLGLVASVLISRALIDRVASKS